MQAVFLLCLLGLAAAAAAPQEKYSTKYDNLDIDKILSNDRVVSQYVKCLLDKGPCTAEGREFRQKLPEALSTSCAKCTEPQKNIIRKASKHIIAKRPADWALISKKFDPKGEKRESFQKFLAASA